MKINRKIVRALLLSGAALGLFRPDIVAAETIWIRDVTVIDGTGAVAKAGQDVLVADGRIAAIGAKLTAPPSARQVDGRGRYLLPGFIDSNVHATVYGNPARRDTSSRYADRNEELALEFAQRQLRAGVTTMRDSYGVLPRCWRCATGSPAARRSARACWWRAIYWAGVGHFR